MDSEIDNQTLIVACGIVRKQVDKLAGHLRRLDQTDDIEVVHQARVACRRMRQAFAFFGDCFEQDQMAGWKKATKRLMRQLSLARDLDVHAAFLQTFMNSPVWEDKKVHPGLGRLMLRIQQRRRQAQNDVLRAAARFNKKKILINIHLQTEKILFQMSREPALTQDALRQRLQDRLGAALEQMKEKESFLDDPKDCEGHHALRIAVKRFRYRMEIADSITGGLLGPFIKTAKVLQTLLGDLHDCVVWQEELSDFVDSEKERMKEFCGHTRSFGRLGPGIDCLSRDRKSAAEELYRQACEYVADVHSCDPWQQVFDIISHQPLGDTHEQTD
jgi:CHAD domain-containing protein